MERSRAQVAADELWKLQLRRENKALLDRFEECQKLFITADAEVQRGYEAERIQVAALVEKVQELAKDYVSRSEWLQYQELQGNNSAGRDAFPTTDSMGEQQNVMPEHAQAARAGPQREPMIPPGLGSAAIDRPWKGSIQEPATMASKSQFLGHKLVQNHGHQIDARISPKAPSARELEAMISEASPSTRRTSEGDEDEDEDDIDLDAISETACLHPQTLGRRRNSIDNFPLGSEWRAPTGSPGIPPSKIVVLRANPRIGDQKNSHSDSTRSQKRPSKTPFSPDRGTEATGPAKILELNEMDNGPPRSAAQKELYGRRPQTRNGVLNVGDLPKLKPSTRPVARLPLLVQGKTPLSSYYRETNNVFGKFEGEGPDKQYEFVNRFLAGIHLKKDRDAAVSELQQAEESTIRNGKPWILCHWRDVLGSLVAAKLLKMEDVA